MPAESPVSRQDRGGEPEPEVEAGQISKGKITELVHFDSRPKGLAIKSIQATIAESNSHPRDHRALSQPACHF